MTIQGAFGTEVKIDISTTLTVIAKVEAAAWPNQTAMIAEVTTHDSAQGYYEAIATGKKRLEGFTLGLIFDAAEATHAEILLALGDGEKKPFEVSDPQAQETILFDAFIESVERVSDQDQALKANVTIHPSGAPTIS